MLIFFPYQYLCFLVHYIVLIYHSFSWRWVWGFRFGLIFCFLIGPINSLFFPTFFFWRSNWLSFSCSNYTCKLVLKFTELYIYLYVYVKDLIWHFSVGLSCMDLCSLSRGLYPDKMCFNLAGVIGCSFSSESISNVVRIMAPYQKRKT